MVQVSTCFRSWRKTLGQNITCTKQEDCQTGTSTHPSADEMVKIICGVETLCKIRPLANAMAKFITGVEIRCEKNQRTGTLIHPLAKAMAKITKGVDIPKIIMYGRGVFIGFSPSLSPALCQYLHFRKIIS